MTVHKPGSLGPRGGEFFNVYTDDADQVHPLRQDVVDAFEKMLAFTLRPRLPKDTASWILRAPFTEANHGEFTLRFLPKWQSWAAQEAQRIGISANQVLSGEAGWDQVSALHDALIAQMQQVSDRRSPLNWLVIARRVNPADLLPAARVSLSAGLLSFALGQAASSPRPNSPIELASDSRWITPQVLTDLDELCSLGMLLYNIHNARRRIAKGQSLRLTSPYLTCEYTDSTDAVERSIQLYDKRRGRSGHRGEHLGTYSNVVTDRQSTNIITWVDLRCQDLVARDRLRHLLERHGPVFPLGTKIEDLAPAAFTSGFGVTLETQAAAAVLVAAWAYLESLKAIWKSVPGEWSQYGYLVCPREWFIEQVEAGPPMPEILGGSWLSGATTHEVVALLHRAHVVLSVGEQVVLDLLTATSLLDYSFERARDGGAANYWGSSFEGSLQDVIDSSPWKPTDALRTLIGKKVKDENGKFITDIDAVALHDKTLYLISAKAFQAGSDYPSGTYEAVTRLARKVEEASEQWTRHLEKIRRRPAALGVDLPAECELTGLVVMPFVPYVPIHAAAAQPVGELYHVSSLDELMAVALRA